MSGSLKGHACLQDANPQNLKESNNKLRQMNEKLLDEVSTLRSQFDQATSMTAQLEKLHSQNKKISAQLRKVTAEKEDFEKRLEINIQLLDEMKAAAESEKREFDAMKQTEIQELKASYDGEVQRYERTLANVKSDNKNLAEQLKEEKGEVENLQGVIASVLSAASSHFLIHFKSVKQLLAHLAQPKEVEKKEEPVVKDDAELKEANKKLKMMKKRVMKEKAENQQLRSETEATQKKLEKLKAESRRLTSDLEQRLDEAEKKVAQMDVEYKQQIQAKDMEIEALKEKVRKSNSDAEYVKNELEKMKSALEDESVNLKVVLDERDQDVREMKASMAAMKRKHAEASVELEALRVENEKIMRKNTALETRLSDANHELAQVREKCDAGDLEVQELGEKYETVAAQLKAAKTSLSQCKTALAEAEKKQEARQKALDQVQGLVDAQKQQIDEVVGEKAKLVTLIEKQSLALQTMEKHCADVVSKCKAKSKTLKERQAALEKLKEEKSKAPRQEEIPPVCWCSPEFPKELCISIKEVAQNGGCPTTAKLKHVLALIAKYYNQQIKATNDNADAVKKEAAVFHEAIDKLLVEIGCLTGDNDLSAETFMKCPEKPKKTVENLREMKEKLGDYIVASSKHEKGLQAIFDAVNATSVVQAITIIQELQKKFEEMADTMNVVCSKNKKQRKTITSMKRAVECEMTDKQRVEKDLHTAIRANIDETKKLKRTIQELRNENETLRIQQEQINLENAAKRDSMIDEHKTQLKNIESRLADCESEFQCALDEKDEEITTLKQIIEKQQCETMQWKRAVEILKKAKFESEQKLLDNISDNESVVKAATERAKKDANDMKSQFQKTLDHFKAKNTELRSLVSNLSDNLKDVEQRNKELTQANQKLTQEREAWQSKYATVQQEQKNERQLMEAKLKAVQLSESSQRETELGDAFALFEREKKSIHTFVANAFPRLFDPRKPMTDESFRSLIKSISAELKKFQKQDAEIRRLLGLTSDESCEAAITQLMMQMYRE